MVTAGNWIGVQDIDGDGKCEIVLHSGDAALLEGATVHLFDDDGTELWEVYIGQLGAGAIEFADVDLDSLPEIVVIHAGSAGNYVTVLDGDGSILWRRRVIWTSDVRASDITGDGIDEILVAGHGRSYLRGDKGITAFDRDGNMLWKYYANWYDLGWCGQFLSTQELDDLTGDGINDIVAISVSQDGFNWANVLYVLRNDGGLLWYKKYGRTAEDAPTRPVLIDLDEDGIKDVVISAERKIYAYRNDGELLWSYGNETFPGRVYLHRFDIDRDGETEIIFDKDHEVYKISKEGKVTLIGTLLNEGRIVGKGDYHAAISSIDVDSDGFDELIIQEIIDGQYYVATVMPPPAPVVNATIDIDPNTLNLKSKGKWITCYIELPDGYNVADINVTTILLNDTIPIDPSAPMEIGDHDGDGIPDIMVKFSRSAVQDIVSPGDATLTITGKLIDGIAFDGSDVIRVIDSGKDHVDENDPSSIEY